MHTANHRKKPQAKKTARASYEERRIRSPEKILWYSAKSRAKKLGVNFTISPQDIIAVWPNDMVCPVLGLKMQHNFDDSSGCCSKTSPTLDRIRPGLGYTSDNIIIMSLKANQIKTDETDPAVFRRVADWVERTIQ